MIYNSESLLPPLMLVIRSDLLQDPSPHKVHASGPLLSAFTHRANDTDAHNMDRVREQVSENDISYRMES
jgi:hypothetical protein